MLNWKFKIRKFEIDMVVVCILIAFMTGCAGFTIARVERLQALAHAGGYTLGYLIGGKADEQLEARVAMYYKHIRRDGVTVDMVNAGLIFLSDGLQVNPGLVAELTYLLGEFGAEFDVDGRVIDLREIPAEYLDAGASGYQNGLWAARWDRDKKRAVIHMQLTRLATLHNQWMTILADDR